MNKSFCILKIRILLITLIKLLLHLFKRTLTLDSSSNNFYHIEGLVLPSKAGPVNVRPAGHMWPAKLLNVARGHISNDLHSISFTLWKKTNIIANYYYWPKRSSNTPHSSIILFCLKLSSRKEKLDKICCKCGPRAKRVAHPCSKE